LTVQPTATGNLIFIRGVGNFTLQPNSDPAVGFAYDGVFITRPMGTISQFFDLDRVELLKGPQGVLYGRNASAGSINLEPRQPVIGETSARTDLSVGNYSNVQAEGAVNLPLGSSAALRVSGAGSSQDHFLAGYADGPEQYSARAQLKAHLDSRLSVRLAADYNRLGGTGIGTSYVGNYVYSPVDGGYQFVDGDLPLSKSIYSEEGQAFRQTIFLRSVGRTLDAIGSRPRQDDKFYGVHARVDADVGLGKLTVIPAWRKGVVDAIVSGSPFGFDQAETTDQTSVEARLAGRRGAFDWLAGAFLIDDSIDTDTATSLSTSLVLQDSLYRTRSRAVFGNVTFHASAATRLSAGLRWTRDRKRYESDSETLAILCLARTPDNRPNCPTVPFFPLAPDFAGLPFAIPQAAGGTLPIVVDGVPTGAAVARSARTDAGRLTDRALTWRAGVEADVGPRTLFYASVETGYRPGGFSSGVGFETYEPERITAYTAGLRHGGFGGRVQLALEAFWWNYRDQQVSSLRPDLDTPPRNVNITDNIGSSRIRGIEADLSVRPWRGAVAGGILQFLDADYKSFAYVYSDLGVPPLTGCDTTLDPTARHYTVDCSAKQPYNSPRWALSLHGRQSVPIGGFTVTAAANTHFRSTRNIGFAFLPEQRIGPTLTTNAQLILGLPGGRAEIAAFVRNIEGVRVPQFMIFHPVSNALIAGTSAPRQWGLRAHWKF
ncbi:MAG TPA: TonB-dependent receptor, partial [Sphingomicrobium sp.]|nr:TonB-dependent receptor [Sphingomicrobium sp.]